MRPHVLTQWLRLAHLYLGLFTAPAILFFALTGALQTLSLNDRSPDGNYTPPHWISVLAQLHKKQSVQLPQRRPSPPEGSAAPKPQKTALDAGRPDGPPAAPQGQQAPPKQPAFQPPRKPLGMQIFFLLVCVSLFVSTFSGAWMAWKYRRSRIAIGVTFLAGIVIPLLLIKW
ncbi:PepSY domain-containing protein [Occallatibacter riparius]|uniref:PepSY domain-containing protein n=1 Tax=Occallatibacter riparius TaxID=1002689 RepID=A0A9J7BPL1_9BACT|nr:PepSY domain-containing protein [Occallatibacter riparius]UWZ83069.1 PepSY domain-containing protein [Occallatibacter riparius]